MPTTSSSNVSVPVPPPMPLPAELEKHSRMSMPQQESGIQKLIRKCKMEPLVPAGLVATTGALGTGLFMFARRADGLSQQRLMRARIAAQGATVLALVLGYLAMQERNKREKWEQLHHQPTTTSTSDHPPQTS